MARSTRYPRLFSPLRLGPVTVANRIVFAAHLTNYAEEGLPTPQHAAYYEARARGGAGLVITEEQATHPGDRAYEKVIRGYDPAVVDGYRRITDAVHRHGSVAFAQINHNGPHASGLYSRLPVWGPSPVADPLLREVPKEMEPGDIDEVVAGYRRVAGHCVDGGFDGVELQCSQSSLLRSFLSPTANRRRDEHGGGLANRARLLLRVVDAVRDALGPSLALGVRLAGDELVEGGIGLDEAVEVARLVEATGKVDYLNTSIGVVGSTLYLIEASMQVPSGYALYIPSALRRAVDLPVVGVGRLTEPSDAERALAEGHCDLVGVVRGQIADPDFAAKARAGDAGGIRRCLSCNQECVGRMGRNRWLGCLENPDAGREALRAGDGAALRAGDGAGGGLGVAPTGGRPGGGPPGAAGGRPGGDPAGATRGSRRVGGTHSWRVVVVGAGPAGLQAAVTAATAGHRVTVLERGPEAGGQVALAARVPSRAELGHLVRNLVRDADRAGVEVRYGEDAGAGVVLGLGPDAVVVATGAVPDRPRWAPEGDARVVDVTDVLAGRAAPTGRVVVVDETGFHQATSVAELLADRGAQVTVLTSAMVVGQDLGMTLDLEHWLHKAATRGIEQLTDLVTTGLTPTGLSVLHHPTGTALDLDTDWVVLAVPGRPSDALYHELREAGGPAVVRAGDCVAPRRAHAAVLEGERVAAAL